MRVKTKKGMTIIEALMAVMIFAMGIAGFTALFSRVWRDNAYALEMGQASMAASQGVNKMVKYIREARQSENGSYPVISADDNNLVFYSDYDSDGKVERVHFYYDINDPNVYIGATEPSNSFPVTYAAGDETTEVVAYRVVNAANNPIFAYYDSHYPEDSVNNPIATPATVPNIRLIRITLHVNVDPNRAPDNIQIQSFSEIRNLNDHDRFGI